MDDVDEIRRKRVQELISGRFQGVAAKFAEAIGRSPSSVSRWFTDKTDHVRNIGEDLARDIEKRLDLPTHWLDRQDIPDGLYVVMAGYKQASPEIKKVLESIARQQLAGDAGELKQN